MLVTVFVVVVVVVIIVVVQYVSLIKTWVNSKNLARYRVLLDDKKGWGVDTGA